MTYSPPPPKKTKEAVGSVRILLQNCQLCNKFPAIFRGIFIIFRGILKFLFIYCTISRAYVAIFFGTLVG